MSSSTNRSGPRAELADPVAGADVKHLSGAGARRDDRVVFELVGVSVAGALRVIAIDLADKRIDVHDQALITRTSGGRPGA